MPISPNQRKRNTFNKLEHATTSAFHDPDKSYRRKRIVHGSIGQDMIRDARSSKSSRGDEDYEGEADHHFEAASSYIKGTSANKALKQSKGYGSGHNMREHGEGKEYGRS